MKNDLVKARFIGYPYSHLQWSYVCRLAFVSILFFAVTILFQTQLLAESDKEVALEYRNRGYALQQKGEYKQAWFYFTRAVALDPENPDLYNDKGLMEEYLGMKDEAEDSYRKALEVDRKYLPATTNLGMLYARQKQYSLAAQYLKQRVDLGQADDPWTLEAQVQLDQIYEMVPSLKMQQVKDQAEVMSREIARAKDDMRRLADKNRKIGFETAYENGMTLLKQKRYDEAIQSLEAATVLDPRSMAARHGLKRAHYDKEKAVQDAQDAIAREENKHWTVQESLDDLSSGSSNTISAE
jgi:tetratricopeptide (TPR) repeat protein